MFCLFSGDCSSDISQKYKLGNLREYFKDKGKGPFGSISPIDVYMDDGFFLYSFEYSQEFPGRYFSEMFELRSHKDTQKIYKCLPSLW